MITRTIRVEHFLTSFFFPKAPVQQQQSDYSNDEQQQQEPKVALVIPTFRRTPAVQDSYSQQAPSNYGSQDTKGIANPAQSYQQQQPIQQTNSGYDLQQDNEDYSRDEPQQQQQQSYTPQLDVKGAANPVRNSGYNQVRTPVQQQQEIKSAAPANYGQQRDAAKSAVQSSYGQGLRSPALNQRIPPPPARTRPLFAQTRGTPAAADFPALNQYQQQQADMDAYSASQNSPIFDDEEEAFSGDEMGSYGLRNNGGYEAASSLNEESVAGGNRNGRMVLLLFDKGHVNHSEQSQMNPQESY